MGVSEPDVEFMGGSCGTDLVQDPHHPLPLCRRPHLDGAAPANLVVLLLDLGGPPLGDQGGQLAGGKERGPLLTYQLCLANGNIHGCFITF